MGNLSKGVNSESANVGAGCPGRNNLPEAQSLKARPFLRSGSRSDGIANAPSAITGATFNNSRRLIFLNFRSSIRKTPHRDGSCRSAPSRQLLCDSQDKAKLQDFKRFEENRQPLGSCLDD